MRRLSRGRAVAALAAAVLAAGACGVELDIQGGPDGGTSGTPDGSGPGDGAGEGSADGGRGDGAVVTTFGDASVSIPEGIDLLAGGSSVKLRVSLQKDPGDPVTFDSVTMTTGTTDVLFTETSPSPDTRDFELTAIAGATPRRTASSEIAVTVASEKKTIPFVIKIARHFRTPGEEVVLNVPGPATTFEVMLWGGGGSSAGANGGAGGFARGQVVLFGLYTVRVGGPGTQPMGGAYGGAAGGVNAGGGGGYSAIFNSDATSASIATAVIVAGGGGGAGMNGGSAGAGGGGGGGAGSQGGGTNGGGAPTTAGGGIAGGAVADAGTALSGGGGGMNGGGGGAGWFGGGGGDVGCGGGGGLSYAKPDSGISATFDPAVGPVAGKPLEPKRQGAGNVGLGGAVLITPL